MKVLLDIFAKLKLPAAISLVLAAVILMPDTASAASPTGGMGTSTAVSQLDQICGTSFTTKAGQLQIFSVGVRCFESVIDGLAESTIANFTEYLQSAVFILMVVYLIILGTKISLSFTAVDKLKSEFFVAALKMAFISWLIFGLGLLDIYNLVLGTYHSALDIVLASSDLGDCTPATAMYTMSTGTSAVWDTMDCQFSKFIGWEQKGGYGVPYTGVPLLFGYVTSKILPANGLIIGGLMFSTIWTLMMAFFRLAFVYILSMSAIILLFSIAPLMVPLMLFNQTKSYFENWYKVIISMIMQPVILFAFYGFIATLLEDTIKKMIEQFEQMKPAFQLNQVNNMGSWQNFNQIFDMVGDAASTVDKNTLLNGITVLVIAWLLMSFINIVSQMAQELSGMGTAPNLSNSVPKFVQ